MSIPYKTLGIFRMCCGVYRVDEYKYATKGLPWQPNSGKNEPKLHWFQFCARNRGIFCTWAYGKVYEVVEFKYATWISDRVKGVAMATKIKQNKPKLYIFQFSARYSETFSFMIEFSGL